MRANTYIQTHTYTHIYVKCHDSVLLRMTH